MAKEKPTGIAREPRRAPPQDGGPVPPRPDAPKRAPTLQRPGRFFRTIGQLNSRQIRVMIASAVIGAVVLLFPPWLHEYRAGEGESWLIFAGFRPAFMPPETTSVYQLHATRVDYAMLSVELLGLFALATGGVRSMADRLPVRKSTAA